MYPRRVLPAFRHDSADLCHGQSGQCLTAYTGFMSLGSEVVWHVGSRHTDSCKALHFEDKYTLVALPVPGTGPPAFISSLLQKLNPLEPVHGVKRRAL